jgi:hypothetical protein
MCIYSTGNVMTLTYLLGLLYTEWEYTQLGLHTPSTFY